MLAKRRWNQIKQLHLSAEMVEKTFGQSQFLGLPLVLKNSLSRHLLELFKTLLIPLAEISSSLTEAE